MRSLLPLAVYCISLVSLQQLLALPAEERPVHRSRSDFLMTLSTQREETAFTPGSQTHVAAGATSSPPIKYPKWLPGALRHAMAAGVRVASPGLAWAQPTKAPQVHQRAIRGRRHAHSGSRGSHHYSHHGQLMRVGCVLGTCQVQNLSHRLYQLIGQSGREDSSPINPRSPHSYG